MYTVPPNHRDDMRHESFQAFPDGGCGAHRLCDLNSPAMNRFASRVLIGGAAGAIGTFFLASALPGRMIAVGLGLVLGAAFALGVRPGREGYVDRLMSGAAMGIPLWGLISVIGIPCSPERCPNGERLRCVHICPPWSVGSCMAHPSLS